MTNRIDSVIHDHGFDPPIYRRDRPIFKLWSSQEWETVVGLRKEDHDLHYIAAALNRTERQVREKIRWMEMPEAKRARRRAQINAWRNDKGEYKSVIHSEASSFSKATPGQLADRDRRLLAHRTLTAIFCGDPPPGFSALDRRVSA